MAIKRAALPPTVRRIGSHVALLALAFSSAYLLVGEDAAPGGPLFALLLIYVLAVAAGALIGSIKQLPPLLGMLIAGFGVRNLPYIGEHVGSKVDAAWSSAVRLVALVLILCRAGLAIDVVALRRLRFVVARLAAMPCLSEAVTVAGLAAWLLDFPAAWACMLGFVVAAISPAVVVPSLLSLQERGFGISTGIPTMVVAAAPLDDVLSIAGFGISLGLGSVGSSDGAQDFLTYARAPLEVVLGIGAGTLGALTVVLLTPAEAGAAPGNTSDEVKAAAEAAKDAIEGRGRRLLLLLGTATTTAFGLKRAQFSGAAALAVLILGAGVAQGWGPAAKPVAAVIAELWTRIAQPLLFGLVGASVVVDALEPRLVGLGMIMLLVGGLVRAGVVMLAVAGQGLRWQDRLFTTVAWMPKATVQAAIGGVALDEAVTDREKEMGRQLLAVAVLAIIVTAPLGAVLISVLGPRMLEHSTTEGEEERSHSCKKEAKEDGEQQSEDAAAAKQTTEKAVDIIGPAPGADCKNDSAKEKL